jgi:methyl-accepting chemotaxis protein
LPQLVPARLVGSPIDVRYPRDIRIVEQIAGLEGSQRDDRILGGRHFTIVATPVCNAVGERLGTVFEQEDRSEEHAAAINIQDALAQAVAGNLDTRLDTASMRGFMRSMGDGVNRMLDAIVTPLRVAADHLRQIAEGAILDSIEHTFKGEFAVIRDNVNTCAEVLRSLIADTTRLVEAAQEGRLGERAELERHWGDFRRIVQGFNSTLDAIVAPVTESAEIISRLARAISPRAWLAVIQGISRGCATPSIA